jgi:hypothetical protein
MMEVAIPSELRSVLFVQEPSIEYSLDKVAEFMKHPLVTTSGQGIARSHFHENLFAVHDPHRNEAIGEGEE